MSVLKSTFHAAPPVLKPTAMDVAKGEVYTWGSRINYYLRTDTGAILIASRDNKRSIGRVLDPESHPGHFQENVEVVNAEIIISD